MAPSVEEWSAVASPLCAKALAPACPPRALALLQLDTQDLPLAGAAEELSSVLGVIADPSAPYPTAS